MNVDKAVTAKTNFTAHLTTVRHASSRLKQGNSADWPFYCLKHSRAAQKHRGSPRRAAK